MPVKQISRFFDELKRRNVFRAGVAYIVLAWVVVQAADILLDTCGSRKFMQPWAGSNDGAREQPGSR